MPIYEYICEDCGEEVEAIQKFSDNPLKDCPKCEKPSLKKKTSMSAFHLKGGGWYSDGYGNSKSSDGKPSVTTDSSTKTEAAVKSSDSKPDSVSKPDNKTKPNNPVKSDLPSTKAS